MHPFALVHEVGETWLQFEWEAPYTGMLLPFEPCRQALGCHPGIAVDIHVPNPRGRRCIPRGRGVARAGERR